MGGYLENSGQYLVSCGRTQLVGGVLSRVRGPCRNYPGEALHSPQASSTAPTRAPRGVRDTGMAGEAGRAGRLAAGVPPTSSYILLHPPISFSFLLFPPASSCSHTVLVVGVKGCLGGGHSLHIITECWQQNIILIGMDFKRKLSPVQVVGLKFLLNQPR